MLAQLQRSKGVHRTFTGLEATVNVLDQANIFLVILKLPALQVALTIDSVGYPRQFVFILPTTTIIILKLRLESLARLAGTIDGIKIAVLNVNERTPIIYAKLVKTPKIQTQQRQLSRKTVQLVVFHVLQAILVRQTLLV